MYNILPKRVSKALRLLEIYVCSVIKSIAEHMQDSDYKFTTVRGYKRYILYHGQNT